MTSRSTSSEPRVGRERRDDHGRHARDEHEPREPHRRHRGTNDGQTGAPVGGRWAVVALATQKPVLVNTVAVSALLVPGNNRFTALRSFYAVLLHGGQRDEPDLRRLDRRRLDEDPPVARQRVPVGQPASGHSRRDAPLLQRERRHRRRRTSSSWSTRTSARASRPTRATRTTTRRTTRTVSPPCARTRCTRPSCRCSRTKRRCRTRGPKETNGLTNSNATRRAGTRRPSVRSNRACRVQPCS